MRKILKGSHVYSCNRKKEYCFYEGADCKKVFSVRTGTIFERSHVPLTKWLYTCYKVITARKGISSVQLTVEIGVTQKTSWFILQRLRNSYDGINADKNQGSVTKKCAKGCDRA